VSVTHAIFAGWEASGGAGEIHQQKPHIGIARKESTHRQNDEIECATLRINRECPTGAAMSYQSSASHFAPTTSSQIPIVAAVITLAAASRAIESRTPSSSR
jgi:hypothetical protein